MWPRPGVSIHAVLPRYAVCQRTTVPTISVLQFLFGSFRGMFKISYLMSVSQRPKLCSYSQKWPPRVSGPSAPLPRQYTQTRSTTPIKSIKNPKTNTWSPALLFREIFVTHRSTLSHRTLKCDATFFFFSPGPRFAYLSLLVGAILPIC